MSASIAAPRHAWVHVARLTLREAVNRRLVLAALVLSVGFVALYALGMVLIARNQGGALDAVAGSVLTALGLYALQFLAAFLALMVAAGAVASDRETGALHALLARPLTRRAFLLGRWVALGGMLAAYVAAMGAAILLTSRLVASFAPVSGTRAVGLIVLEALLLMTLALWGSTRLSAVATGVVTFSLFATAWIAGFIEFIGGVLANAAMTNVGIAVSLVIPSDALWRGASYFAQSPLALGITGGEVPLFGSGPPPPALLAWSVAYVAACLGLAIRTLSRQDL